MMFTSRLLKALLPVALGLAAQAANAQQIVLDEPVRAGELTLFRAMNDESTYFYVLDKPRLASDENGRPQFSFLRYVQNVPGGGEGEGGGILHALVALSVSEEQLRDAQRALQRLRPGARIQGPVVFKSGKFALVSSFTDTEGDLTTQVVGLGNAPLLDGEKAAISMQLTKLGSQILWESFHSPTPDISFSFEMDLEGYRTPKRAVIEADFDQIYEHNAFAAGVASTYVAAEVKGAFDDLRRQGAIRVEQVGEDAQLEQLYTTAYNKIADMMFQPVQGTGTPSVASLTGAAGGQASLLDRAGTMLASARQEARRDNERIRRENRAARERAAESPPARAEAAAPGEAAEPEAAEAAAEAEAAERPDIASYARAEQPREGETGQEVISSVPAPAAGASGETQPEVAVPSFAVVAVFEMKRVRQRGSYRVDLNKATTETITLRFDENIGDLRRFLESEEHFRRVNLDDPLYTQREIIAFVDGLNADHFGEYINFATVHMRKRHGGGEQTNREVRIDRNNFNQEGNAFAMLYGWKGDTDRQEWMEYEYQTHWSFFGGSSVEEPWQETSAGAINLVPPYEIRQVTLDGDPALLQEAQVRSITVKVYYQLGDVERVKQVSLNTARDPISQQIEFMLPADSYEYDYEISWRLRGNRTVSTPRLTTSEATLFVDELPEG
ncbi:MAG: hypothetical protein PVJ64_04115 [Gemmatimonadales bacterium]|jgi:hypothetical protein